jgi:hypothetical protein
VVGVVMSFMLGLSVARYYLLGFIFMLTRSVGQVVCFLLARSAHLVISLILARSC